MTDEERYKRQLEQVYTDLNQVSPSYCVAKWKQVTMHLQNGHTHSCHHPGTHKVSIEELKRNKTALHNTELKKSLRKMMLEGQRPSECDYCWRAEDSGNKFSDRIIKSADTTWAYGHLKEMAELPWDANVDPSYVEVAFSSVCNFKCSYCSPNISSQWMEEIERFGPYPTSNLFNNLEWVKQNEQMPIPNREENPYVDAFWEWWPTMYKELKQFRITGGEPLMTKNTFKVLDYIIENPNPELVFSVNTNMCVPDELYEKFIEKIKIIVENKMVERVQIFTSAEAHGKQSEYIRFGMNYTQWLSNIVKMLREVPQVHISIMSTYNLLSIPTYTEFLNDMLNIKLKFRQDAYKNNRTPLILDMPYLRHPPHQAPFILPEYMLPEIEKQIQFMKDHSESKVPGEEYTGFYEHETYKLERIYNICKAEIESGKDNSVQRRDFVKFVDEHDRRRGTNFLETFPQLERMYNEWKQL